MAALLQRPVDSGGRCPDTAVSCPTGRCPGVDAMTKQYLALARVSSREQEREGFSLDVQEEALLR